MRRLLTLRSPRWLTVTLLTLVMVCPPLGFWR